MSNITFKTTILILSRKQDKFGKLITNQLIKDLQIHPGDKLEASILIEYAIGSTGKFIDVKNNNLTKHIRHESFIVII